MIYRLRNRCPNGSYRDAATCGVLTAADAVGDDLGAGDAGAAAAAAADVVDEDVADHVAAVGGAGDDREAAVAAAGREAGSRTS